MQIDPGIEHALLGRGFARTARLGVAAWTGEVDGRHCLVSVALERRTRYAGEVRYRQSVGYRLRVELATSVAVRAFFPRERFTRNLFVRALYRLRRFEVRSIGDRLAEFRAVGPEAEWPARLAAESDAASALGELLRDHATPTFAGSVYFGPAVQSGILSFGSPTLTGDQFTEQRIAWVLDRLATIARAAERISPPRLPARLTRLEGLAQAHPILGGFAVLGCLFAVLGTLGLGVAAALMVVAKLLSG